MARPYTRSAQARFYTQQILYKLHQSTESNYDVDPLFLPLHFVAMLIPATYHRMNVIFTFLVTLPLSFLWSAF